MGDRVASEAQEPSKREQADPGSVPRLPWGARSAPPGRSWADREQAREVLGAKLVELYGFVPNPSIVHLDEILDALAALPVGEQ